jgi:abnormal spindle-like microcephaly-associated protein
VQQLQMGDVRLKQQAMEVLSAYHPFWLRLGLEIVVGRPVPMAVPEGVPGRTPPARATGSGRGRAELEAFAREHFLNDADLALQRAGNKAIKGLYGEQYWVRSHTQSVAPNALILTGL